MTNQHPRAAADAMLHAVEEGLGATGRVGLGDIAGALTAVGWALLDVADAVREQTAAEHERQAIVP